MAKYIDVARIPSVFGAYLWRIHEYLVLGGIYGVAMCVYDAYLTRICAVFVAYLCASGDTRISCVSESYIRRICVVYEAYWHVSGDTRICCVFEAYMN